MNTDLQIIKFYFIKLSQNSLKTEITKYFLVKVSA